MNFKIKYNNNKFNKQIRARKKTNIEIDLKFWTVLNKENDKIQFLTHIEFKNLLNVNTLKLTG